MFCLSTFLKIGTMFHFFQSSRNIPHFKQFLNILKRGSILVSPDIFNMLMLIIWSWALLGLSLQMILLRWSFVNSMFARYWSVMRLVDEGRTLLFSIIDNCFAKEELKRSVFFLKSSYPNLLSWKIGGMQGTFLPFNMVFSNGQ